MTWCAAPSRALSAAGMCLPCDSAIGDDLLLCEAPALLLGRGCASLMGGAIAGSTARYHARDAVSADPSSSGSCEVHLMFSGYRWFRGRAARTEVDSGNLFEGV